MANEIRYKVGFDVNHSDLNKLKSSLQQLQKLSISDIMKINDSDRSSAITALNDIKRQATNVQEALTKAFNVKLGTVNVQAFNQALTGAHSSLQQVYDVFKRGGAAGENAFRSLVTEVTTSNVQLKETHKLLDNIATTLGNTIKWNLASSAVNMMSQSVQQAWGYVKNLDTSLNDIRIVTNKSAEQMANFAVQANEAAKSLGRTTTDYTKAALIYAQQGLDDEEIAARTAVTLKTANVTGQSTSEVSEQLTAVWNGYKVSAEQAEVYIDRLAAVAATTASDLQELSTGMSKVASAAAAMGVGEDQLAAQLSTIISVTRQAPESVGTALRTIYARITDIKAGIAEDEVDLGRYSGKMAALGFNVLDATGNLRDMGQVMEEIGYKWQDLTREQQVSLAQTMAGQRQYSNLIALFDNFDKYTEALNTAQNAAGTLNEQQSIYLESTAAHLNQLKTAMEDLYDSLLNPDSLEPLIDGLAAMASGAAKFVDALGGGGNLLLSLGGIAANVFSDYLTKGVETFVHNLTLGNDQVKLMEANIATLTSSINIEGLSEDTRTLFEDFRNTQLALAKAATPEEYNQMNEHLKAVTNSLNNYSSVLGSCLEQEDDFQKAQKSINVNFGKMQDFALTTSSTQQNFFNTLSKASEVYTDISDNIDIFIGQLQDQDQQSQISNRNVENFSNLLKEIKNIDFASEFGFQLPDNEIDNFIGKLDQLKNQGLDASGFESFTNEVKQYFQQLADDAGLSIDEFKQKFQQIDQARKRSQEQIEARRKLLQDIKTQQSVRAIGKLVGSFTQLTTSVNQASNAISLFKNGDIVSGLINVGTSLASIATGAYSAATAMHTLGIATGIATGGLTLIIGLATAAIAAGAGLVKSKQEELKATIELNKQRIKQQNSKQDQIQNNKKLYASIEDLNKKYKQGQITRVELRSSVEDLIDQYGIEGIKIRQLAGDYDALTAAIKRKKEEAAEEGRKSAQQELKAAQELIVSQGRSGIGRKDSDGNYNLYFGGGLFSYGDPITGGLIKEQGDVKVAKYLENIGFQQGGYAGYEINTDFSYKSILDLYEKVSQTVEKIRNDSTITDADKSSSELFQNMLKWLDQMKDAVDQYKQALSDVEKYSNDLAILTNTDDLNNIKTVNDYLNQRTKIISILQEKNKNYTKQQAGAAADAYLRENYRNLFVQFDQGASYIEKLREKLGGANKDVQNLISNMDSQHLGMLIDIINLDNIDNWDQLEQRIRNISKIDLSNVDSLTGVGTKEAAADQYTFFQSLEDQVRSGKSISSKEIERIGTYAPELTQAFDMMANGQYRMTEDAKTFYATIESVKLAGFHDAITQINRQIEKTEALLANQDNINYDILEKQNYNTNEVGLDSQGNILTGKNANADIIQKYIKINNEVSEQQIKFLRIVRQKDEEFNLKLNEWEQTLYNDKANIEDRQQAALNISNAIEQELESGAKSLEELEQDRRQTYQAMYDALFPTDIDVEESALAQLSETLQSLAVESDELAPSLADNARAANEIAQAILRFDNAIQDVVDHYDDWLLALSQENLALGDQAVLLPQLRDAYADMLDLDGSLLTDDFLLSTQNLEWMKAAIDGDIQAYENLAEAARVAAIQALKLDPSIDMSHFEEDLAYLENYLNNRQQFPTLEIGAQLNDQKFLEELSNMLNTMGVTAKQASDILRENLGIDAEIIEQKVETEDTQRQVGFNANFQQVTAPFNAPMIDRMGNVHNVPGTYTAQGLSYEPVTETVTVPKENSAFTLKVTSAHKSAGGQFKYTHSSRGGGSAGVKRRTEAAEKAAKAAKKTQVKPDTSTKETKDYAKDDRDIYHDINIEISQINRELERTQKIQDRLFGKQLIANLNKQTDILEKQKVKLKEKINLQKLDLAQQKEKLAAMGATFDAEDRISNYFDLLGHQQGVVNGLIDAYNGLVEQYNAITEKTAKDALKDQITEAERQLKKAQDYQKDIETAIKNFDSLRDNMEDLTDEITEISQKQIEINIKRFRMALEIRLDMSEARRDWNQFKREVEQADNALKDSSTETLIKDVNRSIADYNSYFDVSGSNSIQALTQSLNETMNIIDQIDKMGKDAIYGDDKAQAMQHLKGDLDTLMNSMQSIEGLIQDVNKAILDTVDDVSDLAQKQLEDYDFVNDLYEHDIDLLQLLYGDKQYEAMNAYYGKQQENQLKQIDFLKQYRDLSKQEWDAAVARGESNLAQKWKQEYMQTVQDLNSAITQSVELLQNKYTNAINKIFDTLDKRITSGLGTDYIEMEWELMNKNANEYLDEINSAFAIQQLQLKYTNIINDDKSLKNQKALQKVLDEQLKNLRDKDKLTQYDVDRAEKILQIEQARLALEDQKKNKTSLRLRRDSQGNYSYVYAANQEQIANAEEALAKAQNDLYNFDKNAYQKNLDDILSAWRDFQSKYKEIVLDTSLSEEQRVRQLALLRDQYGEYINNKVAENEVIRTNLMESAFIDYAALYDGDYNAYQSMIESEKEALMSELIPTWNSGVQEMANTFAGEGGFIPACQQGFNDLDAATQEYERELDALQSVADEDFGQLKEGIDDAAETFSGLITQNDELISKMQNDMINAIRNLKDELDALIAKYQAVYNAAKTAVDEANKYIQTQNAIAAAEAAKDENRFYQPQPVAEQSQSLPTTPTTVPASIPTSTTGAGSGSGSGGTENGSTNDLYDPWRGFETTVKGIVGNIWYGGSWADRLKTGNLRYAIEKIFGNFDENGKSKDNYKKAKDIWFNVNTLWDKVQGTSYAPPPGLDYTTFYDYYEMMKKYRGGAGTSSKPSAGFLPFDTGGYTGSWGTEGRLAMLHQKELVLNADDTKNMLNSVSILRDIVSNVGGKISAKMNWLGGYTMPVQPKPTDELQQSVNIQATFPNVNSKREIEEALNDLVNLAAQRALRRR